MTPIFAGKDMNTIGIRSAHIVPATAVLPFSSMAALFGQPAKQSEVETRLRCYFAHRDRACLLLHDERRDLIGFAAIKRGGSAVAWGVVEIAAVAPAHRSAGLLTATEALCTWLCNPRMQPWPWARPLNRLICWLPTCGCSQQDRAWILRCGWREGGLWQHPLFGELRAYRLCAAYGLTHEILSET